MTALQDRVRAAQPDYATVVTQVVQGGQLAAEQRFPAGTALAVLAMLAVAAAVVVLGGGSSPGGTVRGAPPRATAGP